MSVHTPAADATTEWKDSKKLLWLLSPALPLFCIIALALFAATDATVFLFATVLVVYLAIPVADWLVGEDEENPPDAMVPKLENDSYYQWIVAAFIPSQYGATIYGAYLFATVDLSLIQLIGLTVSVGWINGISINTAHELCHKKSKLERWLAKITLGPVAYGHFFVEHVRGHHKNVSTPLDPASSKMGESFWAFLPRTMIGSVVSAWDIEKTRLNRKGKSVWSLENDNLQAWAITVVLFAALTAVFGPWSLAFLVAQAFFGASLLEVVNYIEHYGLLRKQDESGRYERCKPEHSWNSNHVVTNVFLYQLQRHSDHHANPARRFQALRHFDNTPQLPSGYAGMIMVAYLPPLWRALMDKRVAAHYQGDMTKANIHPAARKRIFSKWHTAAAASDEAPVIEEPVANQAVTDAAAYQCPNCNYVYSVETGCPSEGFPAGTTWSQIPSDWSCPDCAVRDKVDFKPIEEIN